MPRLVPVTTVLSALFALACAHGPDAAAPIERRGYRHEVPSGWAEGQIRRGHKAGHWVYYDATHPARSAGAQRVGRKHCEGGYDDEGRMHGRWRFFFAGGQELLMQYDHGDALSPRALLPVRGQRPRREPQSGPEAPVVAASPE